MVERLLVGCLADAVVLCLAFGGRGAVSGSASESKTKISTMAGANITGRTSRRAADRRPRLHSALNVPLPVTVGVTRGALPP